MVGWRCAVHVEYSMDLYMLHLPLNHLASFHVSAISCTTDRHADSGGKSNAPSYTSEAASTLLAGVMYLGALIHRQR